MYRKLQSFAMAAVLAISFTQMNAAHAKDKTKVVENDNTTMGTWTSLKHTTGIDLALILAIDKNGEVKAWFKPGKSLISPPPYPLAVDPSFTMITVPIILHTKGSHICWPEGGSWKCISH